MDNHEDWDGAFKNIVKELDMDEDFNLNQLSEWEIQRAIAGMNEASTYLGRFLLEAIHNTQLRLPPALTGIVRSLIVMTDDASEAISMSCSCIDCMGECDHDTDEYYLDEDDDLICGACLDEIENDDNLE